MCVSALLPGELGTFDAFLGVLKSLAVLYTWVHAYGASVQSPGPSGTPMRDTVPLATQGLLTHFQVYSSHPHRHTRGPRVHSAGLVSGIETCRSELTS